jgi:hypothetical protein
MRGQWVATVVSAGQVVQGADVREPLTLCLGIGPVEAVQEDDGWVLFQDILFQRPPDRALLTEKRENLIQNISGKVHAGLYELFDHRSRHSDATHSLRCDDKSQRSPHGNTQDICTSTRCQIVYDDFRTRLGMRQS